MKSAVYSNSFWITLIAYCVFVELYFRLSPAGHSAVTVFWAWLLKGNARPAIIFIWLVTTLTFAGLAAEHLRNVYVALTGKPDSYVFLGDKLREGMYAARESDPAKLPIFVASLVSRDQYPNATFVSTYDRKIIFQDSEGNLTSADMLNTGRLILFSCLQLALLFFSALCVISMADQFISGFSGAKFIQDFARTVTLPGTYKWGLAALLLLFYLGGTALIASKMHGVPRVEGKALALPPTVAVGSILSGIVVAAEDFEITDNTKRSQNNTRFYRRYAIRFDGPDFPIPVHVNWWKQRIHEGNITVAVGKLKKERATKKAYYDQVFERMDRAMTSGERMNFMVDEELGIVPHIEALGNAPDEDDE